MTEIGHSAPRRCIEKIVADNGGACVVGAATSYADVCLFALFDTLLPFNPMALTAFPSLTALHARVAALPQVLAHKAAHKP